MSEQLSLHNRDILEIIVPEFSSLWRQRIDGRTVTINTPFMLPDSSLVQVLYTERKERGETRFIVADDGFICRESGRMCSSDLRDLEQRYGLNLHGRDAQEMPIAFKSTTERKLIGSIIFDLIHAIMAVAYSGPCQSALATDPATLALTAKQGIQP